MNKSTLKYISSLLLFGSNGIFASLISLSSSEIVMFRTLIGSALLIVLTLIANKGFTFHKHMRSFGFMVLSGVSTGVSWLFLYEAYKLVGVSIASLGYYCGPVIVMALSPLFFKDRITKRELMGFMVVFTGIVFINFNAFGETHTGLGIFYALMSAVMYAGMVIFNKKAKDIVGIENSALQIFFAFLSVFIYVIIRQGFHFEIQPADVFPLLFLGIVNTGIGCFLYFSSIGRIKIQAVAILGYLEPLSAVLFSFIFLHERLLPLQLAGAFCIVAGAVFAEHKHSVPVVEHA